MVDGIFEKGDIVIIQCTPQAGHEQAGKRPALVISNFVYNKYSGFAMVCPITSTERKSPFHVKLDSSTKTQGMILAEQVKSLDVRARKGTYAEKAPQEIVDEVDEIVKQSL